MNILDAVLLFAIIILIYWTICEVFTVLFRFTGLPYEKARFQVLSIITGTGFTTRESENLVSVKPRRRLAQITMLFGYVFNVTVVSAFVNIFVSLKNDQIDNVFSGLMIPLLVILVLMLVIRTRPVHRWIDTIIEKAAGRLMGTDKDNTILLVDYISDNSIAKVKLRKVPEGFKGKTLAEMDLRTESGVQIMLVERADRSVERGKGDTVFREGDKLTVFGDYKTIAKMFNAKEWFN